MRDSYDYRRLLGYQIVTSEVLVKRALLRLLARLGLHLTFEQWIVLNALYVEPGLIQSEVADRTRKDKANITRILGVLERDGVVERRTHADRRRRRIYLTERGAGMLESAIPSVITLNQRIRHGIDDEALAVFERVLATMNDNLTEPVGRASRSGRGPGPQMEEDT